MTALEEFIVLALAAFVAWQLPTWSEKIVPLSVGANKISGGVKIGIQLLLAYFAARVGWVKLNATIDTAFTYLQQIFAKEEIVRVVEVDSKWIALIAFIAIFWLLSLIFKNLPTPQNLWGSLGALLILGVVLFWPSAMWKIVDSYVEYNLEGASGLLTSDTWREIMEGFDFK